MYRLIRQLIVIVSLISLTSTVHVFANDTESIERTKTWCISLIGKSFTNSSEVKTLLLDRARNAVIEDLFKQIVLSNEKTFSSIQKPAVRNYFSNNVKLSDNLEYKNGNQFGEVCITVQAIVSNEAILQFKPFKIKKSYCFFDENITLKTLKLKTKQQAILQALYDYDERLRGKKTEDLLGLAHNIKYLETGFSSTEEKYCVDVTFDVIPAEINIFKTGSMNKILSFQISESKVQSNLAPYLEATVSRQFSIRQGSVQRLLEQMNSNNQLEILNFFLERIDLMLSENHQNGIYNTCVVLANLDNRVLIQGKNQIFSLYNQLKGDDDQWRNTLVQLRGIVDRLKD